MDDRLALCMAIIVTLRFVTDPWSPSSGSLSNCSADGAWLAILLSKSTESVQAGNLFLGGGSYGRQTPQPESAWLPLGRHSEWQGALFVVRPKKMIRWQRGACSIKMHYRLS
jgi:hypothetical protein